MKKFLFFAPLIVVMFALPYFSCKTAPSAPEQASSPALQPAETTPEPTPVPEATTSQTLLNQLNAAIAKAEEARKRADDFDGSSYFPSDWETADERYDKAGSLSKDTNSDIQSAIAEYNAVADAFDSIFNLAVHLYAQAMEDEITALWEELVAAGVRDSFPEYFAPADETAISAYQQYEAKDYYAAKDSADKALLMYQTIKTGHAAWLAREEIVEWDFMSYNENGFNKTDETGEQALENYKAGDIAAAYENADIALQNYTKLLDFAWMSAARELSLIATAEWKAALDIKADIATRDLFQQADSNYKSATDLFDGRGEYKQSAYLFLDSARQFRAARDSTAEKRRIAEAAITEAKERIVESDETARQGEIIMEGGLQ
jgi:hypothetical protein